MAALTRAATKGPQWQARRNRIQRDLEDISFHVTELSTAAKTADRARAVPTTPRPSPPWTSERLLCLGRGGRLGSLLKKE